MREWLSIDELHVIRAFLHAGVRFLITGGRAVQFHGHFRPTKDLDLLVEATPKNGRRLTVALKSLGSDVKEPDQFASLSEDRPAKGVVCRYPVEFITAIKGVRFLDAWADGVQTSADGLALCVLSKPHLILSKLNTVRLLDAADVKALQTPLCSVTM
jgi:hypothetical protein